MGRSSYLRTGIACLKFLAICYLNILTFPIRREARGMASVAPACPKAEGLSPASSRKRCCSHRARGRLQSARGVGSGLKPTAWPRVAAVGSCPTPWPERETAGKEDRPVPGGHASCSTRERKNVWKTENIRVFLLQRRLSGFCTSLLNKNEFGKSY